MATINFDEFLNKYRDNGYGNDNDDEESNNSPLLKLNVDCMYHEMENLKVFITTDHKYLYTSIHLNIRSLPTKYDQLRTMISELNVMGLAIDFIMICETFFNDAKYEHVPNTRL